MFGLSLPAVQIEDRLSSKVERNDGSEASGLLAADISNLKFDVVRFTFRLFRVDISEESNRKSETCLLFRKGSGRSISSVVVGVDTPLCASETWVGDQPFLKASSQLWQRHSQL